MKLDIMSIALGAVGGYLLCKKMNEKESSADAALGALQMGALHTNPAHLGALQMNPAHLGALELNPAHLGALQMNPAHLGALHTNPHGAYARSLEGARGALSPAGYGALQMNPAHLGALAQQG